MIIELPLTKVIGYKVLIYCGTKRRIRPHWTLPRVVDGLAQLAIFMLATVHICLSNHLEVIIHIDIHALLQFCISFVLDYFSEFFSRVAYGPCHSIDFFYYFPFCILVQPDNLEYFDSKQSLDHENK